MEPNNCLYFDYLNSLRALSYHICFLIVFKSSCYKSHTPAKSQGLGVVQCTPSNSVFEISEESDDTDITEFWHEISENKNVIERNLYRYLIVFLKNRLKFSDYRNVCGKFCTQNFK